MGHVRMRNREQDLALGRLLDGEPEPEDGRRIAAAMRDDPAFAAEVRRLLQVDDLLRQHAEPDPDSFIDALAMRTSGEGEVDLADRVESVLSPACSRAARTAWLPWAVAAVACTVAVAMPFLKTGRATTEVAAASKRDSSASRSSNDSKFRVPPVTADESIVALLVNEVDARFADGAAPDAVRFRPGIYDLTDGAVHVRFSSGADVVIPSPARFAIRDPLHMSLEHGSLRALVSPAAHGFTVDAPGVQYEDLGTEFGVAVGQGGHRSEVHVFEGSVNLKSPDGRKLSLLALGQSAAFADGEIGPAPPPDLELYPTPDDIGLLRWRRWRDEIKADPTLVCYYPFDARKEEPSVVADAAGSLDARVRGAHWVSGRWPGKQAMLFDKQDDAVELTIPGEYRQLTISGWIRVERLDFELNAIFDSDGWESGDVHVQLLRSGQPSIGFFGNHGSAKESPGAVVVPGRWTHIAAVVDLDRGWSGVYVDGVLADTTAIVAPDVRLTPGTCRIGDWVRRPDWKHAPERGFRGRIDEFAIWNRVLSESEILKHVEAGRPSLIESVAASPASPSLGG